jgi:hypothetical protein
MSDSLTFWHLKKGYTLHVHTAGVGGGAHPNRTCWKVIHPVRPETAADGVILSI